MSTYIAIFKRKENGYTYNAPTMFIEAEKQETASEIAKNSALGCLPGWSIHVAPFFAKKRIAKTMNNKFSKDSKSQIGKQKTGHSHSRPVRRMKRRLINGVYPAGCRVKTNAKHW